LTSFGLGPNYRPALHSEILDLVYFSNGGFTHTEVYYLPVWLRRYYLKKIADIKTKEKDAVEKASKSSSSRTINKPSIPSGGK